MKNFTLKSAAALFMLLLSQNMMATGFTNVYAHAEVSETGAGEIYITSDDPKPTLRSVPGESTEAQFTTGTDGKQEGVDTQGSHQNLTIYWGTVFVTPKPGYKCLGLVKNIHKKIEDYTDDDFLRGRINGDYGDKNKLIKWNDTDNSIIEALCDKTKGVQVNMNFDGVLEDKELANSSQFSGDDAAELARDAAREKGFDAAPKVTFYALMVPTLTLDEKAEDTGDVLLGTESGKVYDVTLTRTLTANAWNTICLPFDVTAEQIADVLKSAGNVKEFDREDANTPTIYFKDATTMTAGKPYLIKPTESATELVFKDVKITATKAGHNEGDQFGIYGTFGKHTMETDGTELFLTTKGKFAVPAPTTNVMKGFRAYFFNVNGSTAGAALNLSFGEATGIDGVAVDTVKNVKVYNVNGQYVGTSLEALPKGLYIVGGKKVLK